MTYDYKIIYDNGMVSHLKGCENKIPLSFFSPHDDSTFSYIEGKNSNLIVNTTHIVFVEEFMNEERSEE